MFFLPPIPPSLLLFLLSLLLFSSIAACGDDGPDLGLAVGAECTAASDCDGANGQTCLTGFKGGYCGMADCRASDQCPENSACALYSNGVSYCFKTCAESIECNDFRSADALASCSDSAPFLDDVAAMACVPPAIE